VILPTPRQIQQVFDDHVDADRFSMPSVCKRLEATLGGRPPLDHLAAFRDILGLPVGNSLFSAIVRFAFLIELVKQPKIETTRFEVHWATRIPRVDPRYATFQQCFEMFENLTQTAAAAIQDGTRAELVSLFAEHSLLPYEIPLDYKDRKLGAPIHHRDNTILMWDDLPRRVVKLRAFLLDEGRNPRGRVFGDAYGKIKVKTYLTDRALTGEHKSNREKRWETHPQSVQFALRRHCLEIELALINQLCHFEGFPEDLKESLEKASLLLPLPEPFRCPITMEPMSYGEFEKELSNPQMGKASFQVGHLNPLKAINEDPRQGHTAQNISWISSDGNRIQGHLGLDETRQMIKRISRNYETLAEH
jgi:hypothetical protein